MTVSPPPVLLTTDTVGGVWRYTETLAREWAAAGRHRHAQRRSIAAIPGARLVETDLPLDWTADDAGALAAAAAALARLARETGAERVHLHAPGLVGEAPWPAPVVVAVHSCLRTWWRAMGDGGPIPEGLAWRDAAAARGLRAADAIVAPGRWFAAQVAEAYGLDPAAVHAIPNGIAPAPPRATGPRPRAVLASARAWDAAKDVATYARAARRVPHWPHRLAGALQGPNGERAPRLDGVETLGALDHAALQAVESRSSVFVSAARYEPFGLAVLEAARAGLALVLADLPSLREHWDGAARFFPPGDDAALAAHVAETLADPAPAAARAAARARDLAAARTARLTDAVHAALHDATTRRGAA